MMEEPWTGGPRFCRMLGLYSTLATVVLLQLLPLTCAVGQDCNTTMLEQCLSHEMCVQVNKDHGVCKCQEHYIVNKENNRCEEPKPPPEPSSSHLGLGLGLGVTFFVLLVAITLALAHRKFGLFTGMCGNFPSLRIFGIRGQEISLDNNDDDVTPIV